jgi:predicted nucleotidyltransferase
VDPADLEALRAALDVPGVVHAALAGSQARGTARPGSDVDIAVWMDLQLTPDARLALGGRLHEAATRALGGRAVDLIDLHRASPTVCHRAIRDRVVLVERDRDERVRLDTRALIAYWDTEALRRVVAEATRKRLAEGSFGRP